MLEKLGLDAVVHIHFGMSGSFRTFPYPGKFTFFFLSLFLSFFLPKSEEIAGLVCSEGCRRRDDGLMQQQTLKMIT